MTIVYMFPGQNSRYPEMIDRLRQWSGCDRILQDASDVLGRDLPSHYRAGNPQMFSHNRDIQLGVFLAAYIHSERLATEGIRPDASLGLSLGEYKHLVIGGETASVQAAAAWLEEEEFVEARVIDAALPMHSRLFRPAANAFREALEKTEWAPARKAYLPNVDGEFLIAARPEDFVDRLYRHVFNTVQWARSVAAIVNRYPDAMVVEVGPGRILYNAVSREYKHVRCFCTDDPESVRKLQEAHHAA